MQAEASLTLDVQEFNLPSGCSWGSCYAHIAIGGSNYDGVIGPSGVVLNGGDNFTWTSDSWSGSSYTGWRICAAPAPPSAPPAPPSPPPSPPLPPQQPRTWTILSGSAYCEVSADGLCITDGPGNYGNAERCEVRAEGAMFLNVAAFNTESNFDYITIGTDRYSGTVGPVGIQLGSGDTVSWYSDGSAVRSGFTICATQAPPAPPSPPPSPPLPPSSPPLPPQQPRTWTILSGSAYCEVSADGLCITDGPGNYGNAERCEVRAEGAMFLNVAAFNTESNFDYITIGTDRYSGTVGPVGIQLGSGDTVSWYSDSSAVRSGFTICATGAPPPAPPSPPPSPPLPPHQPPRWTVVDGSAYCSVSPDGLCVSDGGEAYGAGDVLLSRP